MKAQVPVKTISDETITVPSDAINLVLLPVLLSWTERDGQTGYRYEHRYEVQYRRNGLWQGWAEVHDLEAAGIKVPDLPPWHAAADALYCFAQASAMRSPRLMSLAVEVFEARLERASGRDAGAVLHDVYEGDEAAMRKMLAWIAGGIAYERPPHVGGFLQPCTKWNGGSRLNAGARRSPCEDG